MGLPNETPGWSEDALHRWLGEQPWPAGLVGSRGHDAAVISSIQGDVALCADQCIEGVHFLFGAGGRSAGRKAVLRTLSDLAATAASPVAVTLTLRAPRDVPSSWLELALSGAAGAAQSHGAELVAGDLAVCPGPIAFSVSAVGSVEPGRPPVGRDRAEPGDVLLLSGAVGGSLVGGRHLEPVPRVEAGRFLASHGARAMMDVSDGLAWDLYRLARASGITALLEVDRVPLHGDVAAAAAASGRDPADHGLHDGEDHELIATMEPGAWETFGQEAQERFGWTPIGRIMGRGLHGEPLLIEYPFQCAPWTPGPGRGWDYGAQWPMEKP